MPEGSENISVSIVLNVMGLRELAVYGFRSWMLQDYDQPYEVILSLFTKARDMFDPLVEGKNPNCIVRITEYEEPEYFNISAANNLGLHLSKGRYVMFANSDIIYPAHFLKRAMAELSGRDICYAIAARMNMTGAQCQRLKPPISYTRENPFSELIGLERGTDASVWNAISPWMLRRDIAFAVGGFDKQVLIAEDRDLTDRVMHYLRRNHLQHALLAMTDLCGYHQHHANTGLFDAFTQSKAVFEPRRVRMEADPKSIEDVVPTPLSDFDALMRDIRETKKPPLMNQYRQDWKGKVSRRARKVWNALAYGK
jgi:hypothetical protein